MLVRLSQLGSLLRRPSYFISAPHVYRKFLAVQPPSRRFSCALPSGDNVRKPGRLRAANPIENILLGMIKATGPISYATYMQMCLSHPTAGYYMNPDNHVFGTRGDFTTSPEISQVFGELVGIWLLSQWMHAGRARKIRLVELGPGRGTLMEDILRVLRQFPSVRSAVKEVHLVETSPAMRSLQEKKLIPDSEKTDMVISWHDSIEEIQHDDELFTLLVAHEFFDALPFRLLQKTELGWQEVLITSQPDPATPTILRPSSSSPLDVDTTLSLEASKPRFRPVLSNSLSMPSSVLELSSKRFGKLPIGTRVEISFAGFTIARRISELLRGEHGSAGSALVIDYGGDRCYGDSFRAFKNHQIVDVFRDPGQCDLTTNVDFAFLKEAVAGIAAPLGPISQTAFLTGLGLDTRVKKLREAATPERGIEIEHAARRLVDPTGMGTQYQVLGLSGTTERELLMEERWPFVDLELEGHTQTTQTS